MSITAKQAVNDTTLTTSFPLPVMRNFSSSNGSKAQVVEALKIVVQFPTGSLLSNASTRAIVAFSTKNHAAVVTSLADADTFAVIGYENELATNGGVSVPVTQTFDFTDGMGNGILLATDNIFVQVQSANTATLTTISAKLFYRIYSATVTEYVGIVQSQQ
jgi:hypothetical protein